ncbi:MAG: phage tail tape measure protein [Bacteroidetes bacterium]|nr:MAG: phage tail tape measure protein [Bacteroidota bacterium]
MSDLNYNFQFNVREAKIFGLFGKMEQTIVNMQKATENIGTKINRLNFNAALDQMNRVANGLTNISTPGMALSTTMADLQAITGIAGQKLQDIEGYARKTAKAFGGTAAESVESYKLLLSQLSPEIANKPAALQHMGESVATLSKTMGGNSLAATEVLTTAMNQFGISTEDPIAAGKTMADMMNVMAAASKEGSAELPQIKAALEQAGMAAKGANVSFEETNAAIQVLDKAGKKGSEGGIALRNALAVMGQGRFMPKETQEAMRRAGVDMTTLGNTSLPLSQRLKALQPVMNDGALLTKLFGMENQNAARALIGGVPEIEALTLAVTGTNTAYEQAAIVMESPMEKNKRLQASVDDLKIALFNGTNGLMGYAKVAGDTVNLVADLAPAFAMLGGALTFLIGKTRLQAIWTGIVTGAKAAWASVTGVLSATMWGIPIFWLIAGIVALIATIGYVIYRYDGWGEAWRNLMGFLSHSWDAFKGNFEVIWLQVQDAFMGGIELMEKGWYKLKALWDEDGAAAGLAAIQTQQNERATAIAAAQNKVLTHEALAAASLSKVTLTKNSKTLAGTIDGLKKTVGIAAPAVPGAVPPAGAVPPGGDGSSSGAGKNTNEAIATGGTKNTTVHVHIGQQIGSLKIEAGGVIEGVSKLRDVIIDELTRAVAMGASLGGAHA